MRNRPTVVIADHDRQFLVYMATLFSRMNFEVVPIDELSGSYDLFRIIQPHLIILGFEEGDASIGETLEALSQDNLLGKVPLIMAGNDAAMAEQCFSAGCSDFLLKPIELSHLHVALQKCLPSRNGMRKHIRAPFNRKVTFSFAGLDVQAYAITLSEGGVYIRTNKPLPVGSKVVVDIPLDADKAIQVNGEIAYTMGLLKGQFLVPPGMAIRFVDVEPSVQGELRQEVTELLIGDMVDEEEDDVFRQEPG